MVIVEGRLGGADGVAWAGRGKNCREKAGFTAVAEQKTKETHERQGTQ